MTIFSIKFADKQTHTYRQHADTSTDNKGRLKLSSARANNNNADNF